MHMSPPCISTGEQAACHTDGPKKQLDIGSEPTLRCAYVMCITQEKSEFWKSLGGDDTLK